jgi:hypothetical protein
MLEPGTWVTQLVENESPGILAIVVSWICSWRAGVWLIIFSAGPVSSAVLNLA